MYVNLISKPPKTLYAEGLSVAGVFRTDISKQVITFIHFFREKSDGNKTEHSLLKKEKQSKSDKKST